MHVHAQPVAYAVHEVLGAVLGAARYGAVLLQVAPGGAVHVQERVSRLHGLQASFLGAQDEIVDLTLALREPAGDGDRASDVRGVVAVLRTDVHHNEVARFHRPPALVIVEHDRVRPRADDARKAHALGSSEPEVELDHRLELVLVHPRPRRLHGRPLGRAGDLDGPPEHGDLEVVLHQPEPCQHRLDVPHLRMPIEHEREEVRVLTGLRVQRHVDGRHASVLQKGAERCLPERLGGPHVPDAGDPRGFPKRRLPAGPHLLGRVPFRDKEDLGLRATVARDKHEPCIRRLHPGEVEEVVLLAEIGVLRVISFDALYRCTGEQHDAISDRFCEPGPAGLQHVRRGKLHRLAGDGQRHPHACLFRQPGRLALLSGRPWRPEGK